MDWFILIHEVKVFLWNFDEMVMGLIFANSI